LAKKLYVHMSADGCIESFLDFSRSRSSLEAGGWETVDAPEEADLVLVNSCVVGQAVEDRCAQEVAKLKARMKPGAEIVVTGCLPAYNQERLSKLGVDFAFSPRKNGAFLERYDLSEAPEPAELESDLLGPYNLFNWVAPILRAGNRLGVPLPAYLYRRFSLVEARDMFFLRINRGCREACSYCATKFAVGGLASVPPEDALRTFDEALAKGRRNVVLCGEETGSYGRDLGTDLPSLLQQMLQRKGDFIISIRQHHPRFIIDRLDRYCEVLSDKRVRSITIPLQSGSDRVLGLMKRRHKCADAVAAIRALHESAPHVMLRTHLIAGFPTETEPDFDLTVDLVRSLPWDMVLVYPFTPRPKTAAESLEPKVPTTVINRRLFKIYSVVFRRVYLNDFRFLPLVRRDPMGLAG